MRLLFPIVACIASRAVAFKYTPRGTVENGAVTAALESNMQFMAQYAAASYCAANYASNTTSNDSVVDTTRKVLCQAGEEDACPDVIADNATDFLSQTAVITNENGFVSIDPTRNLIVLALIGSTDIESFLTDFDFPQTACNFGVGCLVHSGFNSAWLEIQTAFVAAIASAVKANPTYKLVVTGHSLGAATATIAAASLRQTGYPCDLYTFGSPRVFNSVGAAFVSNQTGGNVRVTHWDDPVPTLPPLLFAYRHTSPEYWLSLGNSSRIDYTPSQIMKCYGYANVNCNAQFWGMDVNAHYYYFEDITACAHNDTLLKRDIGHEEAQERHVATSKADIEYFQDL